MPLVFSLVLMHLYMFFRYHSPQHIEPLFSTGIPSGPIAFRVFIIFYFLPNNYFIWQSIVKECPRVLYVLKIMEMAGLLPILPLIINLSHCTAPRPSLLNPYYLSEIVGL